MYARSHKHYQLVRNCKKKETYQKNYITKVLESDECFVCGDERQLDDGVITCWAHFACKECFVELFRHAGNSAGLDGFPAKCFPGSAALGLRLAEHLLPNDLVETYKLKEQQLYLPEALLIYCPDCTTWLPVEDFYDKGPCSLVDCRNCSATTCVGCKAKWATNHTCDEAGSSTNTKPKWMPEYALDFRVKKCPKCRIFIEHREACNMMDCANCKHSFCFVCLHPGKDYHDCPHWNDPEESYDEEGYEKTSRGLYRDTWLDREDRNQLGEIARRFAFEEEETTTHDAHYQPVIGLEDFEVDLIEPVPGLEDFELDDIDESWLEYEEIEQPDAVPQQGAENIDENPYLRDHIAWYGVYDNRHEDPGPWRGPFHIGNSETHTIPFDPKENDSTYFWDSWSKINVSKLSFFQLECVHSWIHVTTWRPSMREICGDFPKADYWCQECDIHVCHDCGAWGSTDEEFIGASGHNMVSVRQWAEQEESPWKAQHRADNDWLQDMEVQWGVARMFDHYEWKHDQLHPFHYTDYGIKDLFESLEEEMRRTGAWYVAEADVGFKGMSMSFHLDTNPFAPLFWEERE